MQVRMLSAMTGRQPVVVKHANMMDPGLALQQPSLGDETRGMLGMTGGEAAASGPQEEPSTAAPGEAQVTGGYDPMQDHMKVMQQHIRLMQQRTGAPKMAAALDFNPAETMLEQAFAAEDIPYEYANPFSDSLELHEKLSSAADHLTSELSFLEGAFHDTLDSLYHEVKVAALDKVELGQMLAAWQHIVPDAAYVKTAFQYIGPRLQEEGVFPSLDAVGASLEKTAHVGLLNEEHPLIGTMADYCQVLDKLAEVRAAREELLQERNRLDFFLKKAAAILPKATRAILSGAAKAGDVLGSGAETLAGKVLTDNPATARLLGSAVQKGVKHVPHAVAVGGGLLAYDEASDRLRHNRTYQKGKRVVSERIPGTNAAYMREMRLAQRGGV
jgi:hypothetical protein